MKAIESFFILFFFPSISVLFQKYPFSLQYVKKKGERNYEDIDCRRRTLFERTNSMFT